MLKVKRGVTGSTVAIKQGDEPKDVIDVLVSLLKSARDDKKISELLNRNSPKYVPVSIFRNRNLGILECLVYFLVEYQEISVSETALLLGRDRRNIRRSYDISSKKDQGSFKFKDNDFQIPITIFRNNTLGPLESLVYYLKKRNLSFSRISNLTARDSRTIWTTFTRSSSKIGGGRNE